MSARNSSVYLHVHDHHDPKRFRWPRYGQQAPKQDHYHGCYRDVIEMVDDRVVEYSEIAYQVRGRLHRVPGRQQE